MNPKFLALTPLLLLAAAQPHAATPAKKVGFVNVQAAVKAMPGSANYLKLVSKADADLKARQKTIQTLAAKANATRKSADITALNNAQKALVTSQQAQAKSMAQSFAPLASKLNAAVAKVAKANGYSVVLDQRVAAQSGLVVYANTAATDVTAAVIKAVK